MSGGVWKFSSGKPWGPVLHGRSNYEQLINRCWGTTHWCDAHLLNCMFHSLNDKSVQNPIAHSYALRLYCFQCFNHTVTHTTIPLLLRDRRVHTKYWVIFGPFFVECVDYCWSWSLFALHKYLFGHIRSFHSYTSNYWFDARISVSYVYKKYIWKHMETYTRARKYMLMLNICTVAVCGNTHTHHL